MKCKHNNVATDTMYGLVTKFNRTYSSLLCFAGMKVNSRSSGGTKPKLAKISVLEIVAVSRI